MANAIFLPYSHLTPSLGVNPFEELFIAKARVHAWAIRRRRFPDRSLRRFDTMPACDGRRTDRQTDMPSTPTRGRVRAGPSFQLGTLSTRTANLLCIIH